ncbi:MAG: hypothetical protein ACI39E_01990 [Acutalibacteraceae bacterium]
MADYDVILNEQLKKAEEEAEKYSQRRRQQADSYAARVGEVYDGLISSAERDYMKSANDTAASYRDAYDANAVSELVARRNAKEAIANAGASNSGLNATQSTAISMMRGNADAQVTANKQAAVDSIMRELDALRSEYRSQAADGVARIYDAADSDINSYSSSLRADAFANAQSIYSAQNEALTAAVQASNEAEQARKKLILETLNKTEDKATAIKDLIGAGMIDESEAYMLRSTYGIDEIKTGSALANTAQTTSYVGALANAKRYQTYDGDDAARRYLNSLFRQGEISADEAAAIGQKIRLADYIPDQNAVDPTGMSAAAQRYERTAKNLMNMGNSNHAISSYIFELVKANRISEAEGYQIMDDLGI